MCEDHSSLRDDVLTRPTLVEGLIPLTASMLSCRAPLKWPPGPPRDLSILNCALASGDPPERIINATRPLCRIKRGLDTLLR